MFTKESVTKLEKPLGSMVINLPLFPVGNRTALNYIPNQTAGIYAWFRSFQYPDSQDDFFEQLIEDIERPKFIERTGTINPYYQVGIRSFGKLSDGKRQRLKEALNQSEFREELQHALGNSIMFQSPLYVGKASNLRNRIAQHLTPESTLRKRLHSVGIDLDKSILLVCPLQETRSDISADTSNVFDEDNEFEIQDVDESEITSSLTNEDLFEEIFSRLFSPQFSIKLG